MTDQEIRNELGNLFSMITELQCRLEGVEHQLESKISYALAIDSIVSLNEDILSLQKQVEYLMIPVIKDYEIENLV